MKIFFTVFRLAWYNESKQGICSEKTGFRDTGSRWAIVNYLTQAIIAESISRLEDAARTQTEFENVVEWWDKRDKRIQDALDKKIMPIAHETFDKGLYRSGDYRKKNVFGGRSHYHEDFLNPLFSCICRMHNLTDDSDLSKLIDKATDKQKAVFFPRVIKNCTPQKIALCTA